MDSSNSFRSFSELLTANQPLEDRLPGHKRYHAHIHPHKKPEILAEHVIRVNKYALCLIDAHRLDLVVDRLIMPLTQHAYVTDAEVVGNFIKRLFLNTIVFHDYGKINENFQIERMGNPQFRSNHHNGIGSQHSMLSAFLYVVEHLHEVNSTSHFNGETQAAMYALTFWFSNTILKHHASYIENDLKYDPDIIKRLMPYLQAIGIAVDKAFLQAAFDNFERKIKEYSDICFSENSHFPIYALLKLNFSLLTGADYYATSAFMMDIEAEDFGVLSHEDTTSFSQKFRSTKEYNRLFFERRKYFSEYPDDRLHACNQENLNILRQKLLGEVLDTINKNLDRNIFYLEAPTGSGKTNISLAAALRFLEIHPKLNKIFYVFPFTTLITQTAKTIRDTLDLTAAKMVQLHSRTGFHSKREEAEDGHYGVQRLNYIDNLFINYPVTLLTHVKFFDILKGNGKDTTYLFHRFANSVVIIDELQSYPPREWDKVAYFVTHAAHYFNIKFILMSATLPKIDDLKVGNLPHEFCALIKNKNRYFHNPNFRNRVQFDFSLMAVKPDLEALAEIIMQRCEKYAENHHGTVKAIIEFIYKRTATEFYKIVVYEARAAGYEVFVLSGTILEPRRKEIIEFIKSADQNDGGSQKILLISTQVVEAGVDIDMDIGFKDSSLIDSDEQLAGRVNRNARPKPATVYIFKLDKAYQIYGGDLRYRITRDLIPQPEYEQILLNKAFDFLYSRVCEQINRENEDEFLVNFNEYKNKIRRLEFSKIDWEFKLIDQRNVSIYVPLPIPAEYFSEQDLTFLRALGAYDGKGNVEGKQVWQSYLNIVHNRNEDFIKQRIELKKIYGIMSQFMFSIYAHSNQLNELLRFSDGESHKNYEMLYLEEWQKVYDYHSGIRDEEFNNTIFF
ncbi:MAG TPA: CRISPR-associated helicase Cas3' [Candidatus Marinimicrobia bacterium]|nr:CRISPR-associated helicase Cas3' [Candidatus Neomarinimicrobiota bacterium]